MEANLRLRKETLESHETEKVYTEGDVFPAQKDHL